MVKEYGYEYDARLIPKLWESTRGKTATERLWGALCLRSGRDALKAIAREYAPREVFLPALSCGSMISPFTRYGHTIRYYRLKGDYSLVTDDLEPAAEKALFLYMDYFGSPCLSDQELERLRREKRFVFIEDRTHDLLRERKRSFQPDYVMASLRKWLPVPDGGLLWGAVTKPLASDLTFSVKRLEAQRMRHRFLIEGDETIKPVFRKIFSTVSELMDGDEPSAMSAYAFGLSARADFGEIRDRRRRNARALINVLSASPYVTLLQDEPGRSDLYVPFTVPRRDEVQRRLSAKGIFHTVIWPLTEEQRQICPVAKNTEETMLAAPCDQRYTPEDMEWIGKETVRVIADVNG